MLRDAYPVCIFFGYSGVYLQECINNALPHSRCSNVTIGFIGNDNWKIQVPDDGIGFIPGNSFTGNSISNLQARAAACGWKINWKKGMEKGTVVEVRN